MKNTMVRFHFSVSSLILTSLGPVFRLKNDEGVTEWGRNGVSFWKLGKSLNFEIDFIHTSFRHFTEKSHLSHYHTIHLNVISVIRPHPLKNREGFGFWTGAGMSECLKNAPELGRNERIRCCFFIRDSTRFVHSEVIPVHLCVIQWRFKHFCLRMTPS